MSYRKKLIEVALPLEAINREAAREKSIRHGHPSTLHIWWARRPLAACRAVLFASLVDDPSSRPDEFPTEELQEKERLRLFGIIERLVRWENLNNEAILEEAKKEILKSTNNAPPTVLDPFCGGGSIPLEAQRLGLTAYASDLNPVPVLITKALIEIPPKFSGKPPINPEARTSLESGRSWKGATGLADDIRFYGARIRESAIKSIGNMYPKGPEGENVIAWLWTRTVKCPNPACGVQMPLLRTFLLSDKKGSKTWLSVIVCKDEKKVEFKVLTKGGQIPAGTVNRRGATCVACNTPVPFDHIRSEGKAGRMKVQLMAIVVEGSNGCAYLSPTTEHERIANVIRPQGMPDAKLPHNPRDFKTPNYGLNNFSDLFTSRQLMALTTFSKSVDEIRNRIYADAEKAGLVDDKTSLNDGGLGSLAYADSILTYLAFAVDRCANYWSSLTPWGGGFIVQTFGRQALPMVWDFAEGNPFSDSTGNWTGAIEWITKCLEISVPAKGFGLVKQLDATAAMNGIKSPLICTDPPYYDNIGYADLSDFFYIWLRRSLGKVYPNLFSTLLVPKEQELVATPYRFGGDKEKAQRFFEEGLGQAFSRMREIHNTSFPLTIFYAFKQSEDEEGSAGAGVVTASTGWETMLEGLLKAGFSITGTWPVRTERDQGLKTGSNVLASSIVLVCRPRLDTAPLATRREFVSTLKKELPTALKTLQHGNIAPVDLAQALIGPGMAIFSRYAKVLEADGSAMNVRTALQIINQELDAYLAAQEGDLDQDTRFCIAWFEQYGMEEGPFGEADVLARAKNTSVNGLVEAEVLASRGGKVKILKRNEYPDEYDPAEDQRLTIWECVQYLIRALEELGEEGAAKFCARLGSGASESVRALAYRLYSICEKKGWAEEALAYNSLITSWPAIQGRVPAIITKANFKESLF